jgi:hypothetical protein
MGRAIVVEVFAILAALLALCGVFTVAAAVLFQRSHRPRSHRQGEGLIRRNRAWFQRERLRRARRTTPWVHYCRPSENSPEYVIGIERVWNGHVLNRKQFPPVPQDDIDKRLRLEGWAIAMAQEHNTGRVGMGID